MSGARFDPAALIQRLERGPEAIAAMAHASGPDAAWKPDAGSWSVLEIVSHLCDEETDDFRARLRSTLEDPQRDWIAIDPEGWAVTRDYASRDLEGELARFRQERGASIAWLRGLDRPDWSSTRTPPRFGPIRAGDLLAAWAAHDALHLRQLSRRLHQLAQRDAGAFAPGYAGTW